MSTLVPPEIRGSASPRVARNSSLTVAEMSPVLRDKVPERLHRRKLLEAVLRRGGGPGQLFARPGFEEGLEPARVIQHCCPKVDHVAPPRE